jgi:hypothetical protein
MSLANLDDPQSGGYSPDLSFDKIAASRINMTEPHPQEPNEIRKAGKALNIEIQKFNRAKVLKTYGSTSGAQKKKL